MHPGISGEKAELRFDNGIIFKGHAFGYKKSVAGEIVFNTGMVGYTETLSDPSYTGQILVLTYPLAGNYGVPSGDNENDFESPAIQVAGLVVSSHCETPSHYQNMKTLDEWLVEHKIPAIFGVDTRQITKHLREFGTIKGSISTATLPAIPHYLSPSEQFKVKNQHVQHVQTFRCGMKKSPLVILVDCGEKASITTSLLARGMDVLKVPYNHPLQSIECSGILLSNGPGDPGQWTTVIEQVKIALRKNTPILGICLGHQILAIAAGASTSKMKFGHRSQNQPCLEVNTNNPRFLLTSQNHGYQIEEKSLPANWAVWFSNVNDGSVEAIKHRTKPFSGVQFHPESSPGPQDAEWIFDEFAIEVKANAAFQEVNSNGS